MNITETSFKDLYTIEPKVHADNRGYFVESYNEDRMLEAGLSYRWMQDNEAKSNYGAIRGLHYQTGEMAQAKLVRVITGKVLDVVVDLRPDSETYGLPYSILLTGKNKRQLLVPRGFAHGYAVLEDQTIFAYKCDNFYSKDHEAGVLYSDPKLDIDWLIKEKDQLISEKDQCQPLLKSHIPVW